ncbi:growth hormone-inducible transmembrane protein [Ischnura elegans]|uniref:growth hormone-inducible transmembrane protein n=1 Tax=Ischnura elegans TaxID=197161 RepID=UPI001ED87974|nr:growth hormone-inducible transmembrane protein [Ischnura elegans]XP_046401947.1 growth hormone-inducible transmembrane protein [Ischnura elegans]
MYVAVRICQVSVIPALRTTAFRNGFTSKGRLVVRNFANDARETFTSRAARRRTLREQAMAPAGETAFSIGKGAVVAGSALGLGALCFYGLGLSNKEGAIDRAMLWPDYVKQRIKDTYLYFGGSIALTAATAVAVFNSPTMIRLMSKSSFLAVGASIAAMMGSGILCRSIPYQKGLGTKQLAWALHSAVVGAVIAPLCFLGGPILIRAMWYTAGVVGGLSAVAACAPSEQFLHIGGPLAIGFGAVFAASLGSIFLPPTTVLGAGLYSISMYGGLILFSGFLLYDTQRIIKAAERHPPYAETRFDPVNEAMGIYMDTVNIFIRIASILAGGGGRRK